MACGVTAQPGARDFFQCLVIAVRSVQLLSVCRKMCKVRGKENLCFLDRWGLHHLS